jgi:hypothetical protein
MDGGDADWFAVDSKGNLGHFTSAGCPFIPKFFQAHLDALLRLQRVVANLRDVGGYRFMTKREPGCQYESWTDTARKGLFGYDYDLYHLTGYILLTVPDCPIHVEDLPALLSCDLPVFPGTFDDQLRLISAPEVLD